MPEQSTSLLINTVFLAYIVAGCTPEGIGTRLSETNRNTAPTSSLVHHVNGQAIDLSDSVMATRINSAALEVLQSCQSRSKQGVSAADWQAARQSPDCLELRISDVATITMDNGSDVSVSAMMLVLDADNPGKDKVLTLHDGHYRSPFISCDVTAINTVRDLIGEATAQFNRSTQVNTASGLSSSK